MHILILPSWYPTKDRKISGIFFKEQAEALAKKNVTVGCIALNESSPKNILNKNKNLFDFYDEKVNNVQTLSIVYPIPNRYNKFRRIIRSFVFKQLFKRYVKRYGKPDVVHLHSFIYGNLAIWIKEKYLINYIVTEHSSGFIRDIYNKDDLSLANQVFTQSSLNLCVSKQFKKLLEYKFKKNFIYIPNLVDTDYYSCKKDKKQEKFNFINIAFLNKNKNQEMLIKAFTQVFSNNKNVTLTIVGNGIEYENLNILIKKSNMENQINLYGIANREEILKLLNLANIFILTSLHETFGVVLIEAMSCGLPVISTKCGGPEDIIQNKKVGNLCAIDKDSIAFSMEEMYNNYNDYNSQDIIQYIKENFSKDVIITKLLKLYKDVIDA